MHAFDDFGLYVLRGDRLFLAFRCGRPRIGAPTSHAHDDNLALELVLDGESLLTDPGSFLYTALPEERNRPPASE